MEREKLFKLINLALDIQEGGTGENKYPFVLVSISNYGTNIRFEMMDCGFRTGAPYDGCYTFSLMGEISQRKYNTCLQHLEELKKKAEGFFK